MLAREDALAMAQARLKEMDKVGDSDSSDSSDEDDDDDEDRFMVFDSSSDGEDDDEELMVDA